MNTKRKYLIVLGLVLCTALLIAVPGLAGRDPFIGKWYSIDMDGSEQWMTIGGSSRGYHLTMFDYGATACSPDGGVTLYPARVLGWGTVEGNVLTVDLDLWCLSGPLKGYWGAATTNFVYDEATNSLISWFAVWHR
jgi:hypothetical protein